MPNEDFNVLDNIMNYSIAAKSLFAKFLWHIGFIKRQSDRLGKNKALVLMYHRITHPKSPSEYIEPGMYVNPATFHRHIQLLKQFFEIVPLKDLMGRLEGGVKSRSQKPTCALTFDDGWYDFYKYAFPILVEFNAPATVFLPIDYIGSTKWFWTDVISDLLRQRAKANQVNSFPHLPPHKDPLINTLETLSGSMEYQANQAIHTLKRYRHDKVNTILEILMTRWRMGFSPPGRAFLSWDEVRTIKNTGLVTFGSHTMSHALLTTLDHDEIKIELRRSLQILRDEMVINHRFIPFCYPNGNYTKQISNMVRQAGYHMAVSTKPGWIKSKSDRYSYRRIGIHQDMTQSDAMFGCRITGVF